MRLVKSIANTKLILFLFLSFFSFSIQAQDNAPYSRYGIGTNVPRTNIVSRGMGGISAAYYDFQSINFVNPAAISNLNSTTFDLGGEIDMRTLKSNISPAKYSSANTVISYLQFGFPVSTKKMLAKKTSLGVSFGLRPLTRISYKIQDDKRLTGIDTVQYLYEGTGGINQASLSTGLKINRFAIGFTFGYNFGKKDYSSKLGFQNDTVIYYKSNYNNITTFHSFSVTAGLQYEIPMKKGTLHLGAYGTLSQKLKAERSVLNETFAYDGTGGIVTIDTVDYQKGATGIIDYPLNYGFGFTYHDKNNNWLFGADYESTSWSDYKYYGASEGLKDNYYLRVGAQYYPATTTTSTKNYFRFVKYRTGFYYGNDQIAIAGNRKDYGFTAGAGFPLTSLQRIRYGEFAVLNTALEFGAIGNKSNGSIRENVMRFNIGVSLNARWFQKRKYD